MIEISNLTKKYGSHTAVDDISFTVNDGEILGFLGPNGAGKTTTMNIMTGYISSTEGSVKINGFDILDNPEKAKKHIGYLPDVPPLYGDMTILEYLRFVCDIKKVKKSERQEMIENIMSIVKLEEVKTRVIKNLSKGYRQRVGLAQALIGFPEVLILDEPTNGLDPKQIIEMREVIKSLGSKHTVILSSHILSEVSAVCDRVMIINKGKIVAGDTPERLSESITKGHRLEIRAKGTEDRVKSILEKADFINTFEFIKSREENTCEISLNGSEGTDIREDVFRLFSENDVPILLMKPLDLSLEEIFLKITNTDSQILQDDINEEGVGNEENEEKEVRLEIPSDAEQTEEKEEKAEKEEKEEKEKALDEYDNLFEEEK